MLNQSLHHLTAYVFVRSEGKLFSGDAVVTPDTIDHYRSSDQDTQAARRWIQEMGFTVERVSPSGTIRISGSSEVFQNKLGLEFERGGPGQRDGVEETELPAPLCPTPNTETQLMDTGIDVAEGIVFPQPMALHQGPSQDPPNPQYHHLNVPEDIVNLLHADAVHAAGFRGQGTRAAMIDSGFHWSHPYFRARGYNLRVALQPGGVLQDENGHGTGESANLLAVAPDVQLYGVAMDDIVEAFQVARDDLGVQVISNSWGTAWATDGPNGTWHPFWSLVQAEIALCVQQGIIVLFSGGNGGMSFTASMPETISVGGVYVDDGASMEASNYASSFRSTRYPGQQVPEICGLVGMQPKAIYITLPIPPGSEIDRTKSGGRFPNRDETANGDGWGVFSGTSASCPQAAGVVALILSKHPGENLASIRQRLYNATDVTKGQSSHGDQAQVGFDDATGHGLINADLACR